MKSRSRAASAAVVAGAASLSFRASYITRNIDTKGATFADGKRARTEGKMLFSYPNVWNTCLLLLRGLGYRLFLTGAPDELGSIARCAWKAEKGGIKLRGDNPIELLGLAALYEYHRPTKDLPYWWRSEGENVVAELEAEWRQRANHEPSA